MRPMYWVVKDDDMLTEENELKPFKDPNSSTKIFYLRKDALKMAKELGGRIEEGLSK